MIFGLGFALGGPQVAYGLGFAALRGEKPSNKALHFNPGPPYQGVLARRRPPRRLALRVDFQFNWVGRDAGMRPPRAYYQRVGWDAGMRRPRAYVPRVGWDAGKRRPSVVSAL